MQASVVTSSTTAWLLCRQVATTVVGSSRFDQSKTLLRVQLIPKDCFFLATSRMLLLLYADQTLAASPKHFA